MGWKILATGNNALDGIQAKAGTKYKLIYRGISLQYVPESLVLGAIRRGYNNEQTATVDDVRIITRNKQRGTYDVAVTLTAQPAKNTGALNKPGVAVVSLFMIAGGIALSAYVLGVLKETLDEVQEFTTISVGDTKFNFAGLAGLVAVGLAAKFLWKGKLA